MRTVLATALTLTLLAVPAAGAAEAKPKPPATSFAPKKDSGGPTVKPRIIGGYLPAAGSWPWMAAVQKSEARTPGQDDYQRQWCGGVLVHPRIVVTAAHCVVDSKPADWRVLLGRHDLLASGGEAIPVLDVRIHPGHVSGPPMISNDVALLILARPAQAEPAQLLPTDLALYEGNHATVMGWGQTAVSGPLSRILRAANVPLRGIGNCQADYGSYAWKVDAGSMICAGFPEGGNNTCSGDSGGPLMVFDATKTWRLVGIDSWAHPCAAAGYPTVFNYVGAPQTRAWITAAMAELTSTPNPTPTGAGQPAPTTPTGGGADTLAPRLTVRVAQARLRRNFRAVLRYTASEAAAVDVQLVRRARGAWRPVTRVVALKAAQGANSSSLRTRLKRGEHRLLLQAADAAGNRSRVYAVQFRIGR